MTTIHKLTWNKKDLAIYVNFDSKSKQLIETYWYEGTMFSPIDRYSKELDVKFKTYDLTNTKRLNQLADFWAYMPIDVDKDHAGQRTKFYNYITAKNLFGYDTDNYTPEDMMLELSIKLWLAYYYRKRLFLLYKLEGSIFEHLSPKISQSPNDYGTCLKVRYNPKSNLVRLELIEWGNHANTYTIVLPYDLFKPTGITGQYLFENLELLFRDVFNLPSKKGRSK